MLKPITEIRVNMGKIQTKGLMKSDSPRITSGGLLSTENQDYFNSQTPDTRQDLLGIDIGTQLGEFQGHKNTSKSVLPSGQGLLEAIP